MLCPCRKKARHFNKLSHFSVFDKNLRRSIILSIVHMSGVEPPSNRADMSGEEANTALCGQTERMVGIDSAWRRNYLLSQAVSLSSTNYVNKCSPYCHPTSPPALLLSAISWLECS